MTKPAAGGNAPALSSRRQFLGSAAALATGGVASAAVATPTSGPLIECERRWLQAVRGEVRESAMVRDYLARAGRPSVFEMSSEEFAEMDRDIRAVIGEPNADRRAAEAAMADIPASDRHGIAAKLRVALGRGRQMPPGSRHMVCDVLVESVLADIERMSGGTWA